MKKAAIVFLYLSIIMLILSAKQSPWFGHSKKSNTSSNHSPLLNEASAFVNTFIPPGIDAIDPDQNKNWALRDNSEIHIKDAWKLGSCNREIVVAIIDTGIDYQHIDLKENLWKNPAEIADNGKDDDDNGFVDDIIGWDFVSDDNLPYDDHGHGTHVSGIIGAVGGNGIGISGVCSKISLMILKYYDEKATGRQNLENTIKAFQYAVDHKAHIINYSGGGSEYSAMEKNVILEAQKKGILVVAAAGNEKQNADIHAYYPASYDLDNIIAVASLTASHKLVNSSNYGIKKIDLAAPGKDIYSTLPHNEYGYMTGTSQATAFVTGIAALALSVNPSLSFRKLKAILMNSTTRLKSLRGKIKAGGMINAYGVLKKIPPPKASVN